jgi:hypothetical protein
MKRWIALALIAMLALSLSGCADFAAMTPDLEAELTQPEATVRPPLTEALIERREDFYRYYNRVSLQDRMADLTARFPDAKIEAAGPDGTYNFTFDDGFGFVTVFGEDGAMRAKTPFYLDIRQLKPIAPGKNLDQASLLSKGQPYAAIAATFSGKGLEIMQMPPESAEAQGVRRLYLWIDEANSGVEALFDEGEAFVSANFATYE